MFPNIRNQTIALDLETTGLKWFKDKAFGVAISTGLEDYYFDIRTHPQVFQWLQEELRYVKRIVNQNIKFDAHFLIKENVKLPQDMFCTMVAGALLDEHRLSYSLDALAKDALGEGKIELPFDKDNMWDAPIEMVAEYAKKDTDLARRLYLEQCKHLKAQELIDLMNMEMNLLKVIIKMEQHGVRVDIEKAEKTIPILDQKIDEIQIGINKQCGRVLNVNSTPQIRELFKPERVSKTRFKLIDGTIAPSTKSGNVCIDQNVLRDMTHPIAIEIMRLRKYIKARDTFIKGHVLGYQHNGHVHTSFNQTKTEFDSGAGTGRLSASEPALQQISKRDKELAVIIRSLFLPDEGHEWLTCDHSQIDFRIAAHLQNDPRVVSAYNENPDLDYHRLVAEMMNIPRDPPYAGAPNAKQINLGLQFGAGPGKSAKTMKMPHEVEVVEKNGKTFERYIPGPEAMELFNKYHAILPETKRFANKAQAVAASRGYVKTILGRRIRFPNGIGVHKAAGLLYQANAAEVHKTALIEIDKSLSNCGSELILSEHDEVGISLNPEEKELIPYIKQIYCNYNNDTSPFKLRVPIRCSEGTGPNWYEASK